MIRLLILCAAVIAVAGCSDPYDLVVPPDPSEVLKDPEFNEAISSLPEEDRKDLGDYCTRMMANQAMGALSALLSGSGKQSGGIPPGTTVRSAIDSQRKWKAEQKVKAEEDDKTLAAALESLEKPEVPENPQASLGTVGISETAEGCQLHCTVTPHFTGTLLSLRLTLTDDNNTTLNSVPLFLTIDDPVDEVSRELTVVWRNGECSKIKAVRHTVFTAE